MAYFKVFDPATGNLVMDDSSVVFRVIGKSFIVGASTGDPWLSGATGDIFNDGFLTGTPYCWALWQGTVNNGAPSSADPPAPNIVFSGNALTYSYLWGDWWLIYGVA